MSPEITVLLLNFTIILLSYIVIYPKTVAGDCNKLMLNDGIASTIALSIVGSVYWGSDVTFNAIIITLNWFWFALLSYAIIEIPLMLHYIKKHNITFK